MRFVPAGDEYGVYKVVQVHSEDIVGWCWWYTSKVVEVEDRGRLATFKWRMQTDSCWRLSDYRVAIASSDGLRRQDGTSSHGSHTTSLRYLGLLQHVS
jgi:hypothetical protein